MCNEAPGSERGNQGVERARDEIAGTKECSKLIVQTGKASLSKRASAWPV